MTSKLYKLDNYVTGYSNIINSSINEYDISQANINILYDIGLLNDDMYNWLRNLTKKNREITVGYMCKDKNISKALQNGFIDARRKLFEFNNIEDESVLSIKKDAVYLIERTLMNTRFNSVYFRLANTYTSFYKIGRLELYYNGSTGVIDVKGISDETIEMYHKNHFLALLQAIFYRAENSDIETMMNIINFYIEKYVNYELDYECYREFNRVSSYRLKYNLLSVNDIGVNCLQNDIRNQFRDMIDISYNYQILLTLYGYYFDRFMDKS